jgi:hypothetical protein
MAAEDTSTVAIERAEAIQIVSIAFVIPTVSIAFEV